MGQDLPVYFFYFYGDNFRISMYPTYVYESWKVIVHTMNSIPLYVMYRQNSLIIILSCIRHVVI